VNLFSKILICALLSAFVISCKQEDDFSVIPELEVRDFVRTSDTSALWIIGFRDGDGNIGVKPNENLPDNFVTQVFVIENGVVVYDTAGQGFRVPPIEGVETENGIEGELRLNFTGLDLFGLSGIDSLYYTGYLLDRDGNQSNTIETPIIGLN